MRKTCRGFTLIELLITISIIGLLFSLGIARYTDFNRRQSFDQAVLEFKGNLRLAQQKALSGEKDSDCDFNLDGWVLVYVSEDGYQIHGKCGASDSFGVRSFTLPSGVTFTSSFPPITFRVLGYGPKWDTDVAAAWIIGLTDLDRIETIEVTKSGEIK